MEKKNFNLWKGNFWYHVGDGIIVTLLKFSFTYESRELSFLTSGEKLLIVKTSTSEFGILPKAFALKKDSGKDMGKKLCIIKSILFMYIFL